MRIRDLSQIDNPSFDLYGVRSSVEEPEIGDDEMHCRSSSF